MHFSCLRPNFIIIFNVLGQPRKLCILLRHIIFSTENSVCSAANFLQGHTHKKSYSLLVVRTDFNDNITLLQIDHFFKILCSIGNFKTLKMH